MRYAFTSLIFVFAAAQTANDDREDLRLSGGEIDGKHVVFTASWEHIATTPEWGGANPPLSCREAREAAEKALREIHPYDGEWTCYELALQRAMMTTDDGVIVAPDEDRWFWEVCFVNDADDPTKVEFFNVPVYMDGTVMGHELD